MRIMPHAQWISSAGAIALRARPRQHRQLHHDAARLQGRLAVSQVHAADGGDEAGYQRSGRLLERAGESAEWSKGDASGAKIAADIATRMSD